MSAYSHILDGYRILDFTQFIAGPTVTRLLAEMGAEVIKVELAPGGDPLRTMYVFKDGRSSLFVQHNRGKMSLCLDAKSPAGRPGAHGGRDRGKLQPGRDRADGSGLRHGKPNQSAHHHVFDFRLRTKRSFGQQARLRHAGGVVRGCNRYERPRRRAALSSRRCDR
jgi:hypothetical protein